MILNCTRRFFAAINKVTKTTGPSVILFAVFEQIYHTYHKNVGGLFPEIFHQSQIMSELTHLFPMHPFSAPLKSSSSGFIEKH